MKINKGILSCLLVVASVASVYSQYNEKNLMLEPPAQQAAYRYGHLQFYPVRAGKDFFEAHRSVGDYVMLSEALEKKKVVITEYMEGSGRSSSGGVVNTLVMENVSADTIMILAGEVVQGGKQDRMVANDILLYPKAGKQEVPVFCVEHGRWQPRQGDMSFKGYYTISSKEVRKAGAVTKSQQEVWDKVSVTTGKNEARTTTGTLAALKESDTFGKELKAYADHFQKLLWQEPDVIGLVAVSGDSILGCDLFATHGIFAKHYTNLVQSYATEAITSGKEITVPYQKVKEYLRAIIADESRQEQVVEKNGTLLKEGKKKIHIATF